jgi:glycosyltransferase involved in cell wall biosynthesis
MYTGPWPDEGPARSQWLLVSAWLLPLVEASLEDELAVMGPRPIGQPGHPVGLHFLALEGKPSGLAGRWLYRRRLQKTLSRWQPALVLNMAPDWAAALRHPQVLLLHPDWQAGAAAFFHGRSSRSRKQALQLARQVVVAWPWQQAWLQEHYALPAERISVVGACTTDHFQVAAWAHRETLKEEFAQGAEYFLFAGPARQANTIITLLKAFSTFKKRQRSSLRLVLALTDEAPGPSLQEKLDTYKYRQDLVVMTIHHMDQYARLAAGAYAVVAAPAWAPAWWLLGALQCGTALVAEHRVEMTEVLEEAALYVEAWKPDLLAEALMLLYKDESQRSHLIQEGHALVQKHRPEALAARIRQAMLLN